MSLILNIDTALGKASICLSYKGEPLQLSLLEDPKDHAAWLHHGIASMLKENNRKASDLDAIGVSIGPGSYTGLRVGLAAAKGLCYALQVPLIAISTLETMALAVQEEATDLICPMIDARRMEVFAAVYDSSLREKISPHALIIDENSFAPLLSDHVILFCGTGSKKLMSLRETPNAIFSETPSNASHLGILSARGFQQKKFADLVYTEPLYIKEFYSPPASKSS